MTRLVDARTSMGSNATESATGLLPVDTPVLLAQVGLNVPSTTLGIIRVQFDGAVGVQLPVTPAERDASLTLVRGTLPTDPVVYESFSSFDTATNNQLIPLSASDYNVPAPIDGVLVYTLFLTAGVRPYELSGPISLNASAYTDS